MAVTAQSATRSVVVALPIVVVAGCLISLLSFGPRSIMGLFLTPMTEARGWSREIFALSIAIQNIMWGIGQPFAGALADRYGSGRCSPAADSSMRRDLPSWPGRRIRCGSIFPPA